MPSAGRNSDLRPYVGLDIRHASGPLEAFHGGRAGGIMGGHGHGEMQGNAMGLGDGDPAACARCSASGHRLFRRKLASGRNFAEGRVALEFGDASADATPGCGRVCLRRAAEFFVAPSAVEGELIASASGTGQATRALADPTACLFFRGVQARIQLGSRFQSLYEAAQTNVIAAREAQVVTALDRNWLSRPRSVPSRSGKRDNDQTWRN